MRKLVMLLILALYVGVCEAQVRLEFLQCLKNTCSKQLLECQNSSDLCGADMKKFAQCQATSSVCNSENVPEDDFYKVIGECIDSCEVDDSTSEFDDYLSCIKACYSSILNSISLIALTIIYITLL